MAEIEHSIITDCLKCANMVVVDETEREKPRSNIKHLRYPDLGELVEHFGSHDAWRMAKEWPADGALIRTCKRCDHVWITHTYDRVDISYLGESREQ